MPRYEISIGDRKHTGERVCITSGLTVVDALKNFLDYIGSAYIQDMINKADEFHTTVPIYIIHSSPDEPKVREQYLKPIGDGG
jgi:hypothetical protein